jgi:hypothetical protein
MLKSALIISRRPHFREAMKNDDPLASVGLRNLPRSRSVAISIAVLLGAALLSLGASETQAQNRDELRPPTAFAGIADAQSRSRALFTEAFKVMMSPRCMNCHPAGDRPLQGNDQHPHFPPVVRGPDGGGVPGNTCRACHTDRNFTIVGGEGS